MFQFVPSQLLILINSFIYATSNHQERKQENWVVYSNKTNFFFSSWQFKNISTCSMLHYPFDSQLAVVKSMNLWIHFKFKWYIYLTFFLFCILFLPACWFKRIYLYIQRCIMVVYNCYLYRNGKECGRQQRCC